MLNNRSFLLKLPCQAGEAQEVGCENGHEMCCDGQSFCDCSLRSGRLLLCLATAIAALLRTIDSYDLQN